jgi:hypothetical protein
MKRLKLYALAAVAVLLAACETQPVAYDDGKLPDGEALTSVGAALRSTRSPRRTATVPFTEGATESVDDNIYIQLTGPATSAMTFTAAADMTLVEPYNEKHGAELLPLPAANVNIANGGTLTLAAGARASDKITVTFSADGLAPGTYLLPVAVKSADAASGDEDYVLYYGIRVRGLDLGDYELETEHMVVMYLNTDKYQPLLADKWMFECLDGWTWEIAWQRTFGNIVNLRVTQLDYDAATGRALFVPSPDMRYVLEHADKYIRPLQDKGRKVCFSIEGAGTGLGFCNLSDAQIADFVSQVKTTIELYDIDGVNLFDRYSGYGTKEGMPAMNTTSYPKLIKALREALGSDKLITLSDYEEPTEYFWDTEATGGIAVGEYIDYAWSGYMSEDETIQLLDPYKTIIDPNVVANDWGDDTFTMRASEHERKPIAGLDKENFGHFAIPFYGISNPNGYGNEWNPLYAWKMAGYNPNNIVVFNDIISNQRGEYEGVGKGMPSSIANFFDGAMDWSFMYSFYFIDEPQNEHYGWMLKDW